MAGTIPVPVPLYPAALAARSLRASCPPCLARLVRSALPRRDRSPSLFGRTSASHCYGLASSGIGVFPSSQRRARSASPVGRSLKSGCADSQRAGGADGVARSASPRRVSLRLSRHPSSARASTYLTNQAPMRGNFEIGRILHLKSEIRNF